MTRIARIAPIIAVVSAFAATAPGVHAQAAPVYANPQNWLCWPGRVDACSIHDIASTVVAPDGSTRLEPFRPDPAPKVDCFYVYPTVSTEPAANSDLTVTTAERNVAFAQAARFAAACRVYAPMYRQVTLAGLRMGMAGKPNADAKALAAADVLAAWRYYMAHENHGRGVVLIGHSQGAGRLTELLQREIDGKPVQRQIISAILAGGHVEVATGRDVGGDFRTLPLCHSATQTGCVVAFNSFRAESPPPADAYFARTTRPDRQSACTNPAALGGGKGDLHAYMVAFGNLGGASGPAPDWSGKGTAITTPFVSLPGLLHSECVTRNGATYLEISVADVPGAVRGQTYNGDIMIGSAPLKSWGLHNVDINLTQGNLVALVQSQSRSWLAQQP
jgi:hypothetical protein